MYSDKAIDNVCHILGTKLRPWQREMIRAALDEELCILQGARQATGKTWCMALIATLFILDGLDVLIAMPTMSVAESVLFNQINENLLRCQLLGLLRQEGKDRVTFKQFVNLKGQKASLEAVSTKTKKFKEGKSKIYLIIVDEGQSVIGEEATNTLAALHPMLTNAMLENKGRFIITGRGGPRESLIVKAREFKGISFKRKVITASYISTITDQYNKIFDIERKLLGELYDVHYECADMTVGSHYMFSSLDPVKLANDFTHHIIGIDVGGTSEDSDWTCTIVMETDGTKANIIDCLRLRNNKVLDESFLVAQFINKFPRKNGGVAMEANGIGKKFLPLLREKDKVWDCVGIDLNPKKKWMYADRMERMVREGLLGSNCKEVTDDLLFMTYSVDEEGKYKWRHSDIFSACLMAISRLDDMAYL